MKGAVTVSNAELFTVRDAMRGLNRIVGGTAATARPRSQRR